MQHIIFSKLTALLIRDANPEIRVLYKCADVYLRME